MASDKMIKLIFLSLVIILLRGLLSSINLLSILYDSAIWSKLSVGILFISSTIIYPILNKFDTTNIKLNGVFKYSTIFISVIVILIGSYLFVFIYEYVNKQGLNLTGLFFAYGVSLVFGVIPVIETKRRKKLKNKIIQ